MSQYKLHTGSNNDVLNTFADNSVDSIITDPPYELGFMGKSWDSTGIAYDVELWKECLRVLKPGGHLLAFSGTRTYHRMAVAIEDAGFEVRDMIEWVYGSGFPKSLNIGKAVDKLQGNEREKSTYIPNDKNNVYGKGYGGGTTDTSKGTSEYEGWGTALKPAHEPICMARKPISEKTVAENCLKWGTGGINIDESRVGTEGGTAKGTFPNEDSNGIFGNGLNGACEIKDIGMGRFPANLIHDNSEEVRECFPETKSGGGNKGNVKDGTGMFGSGKAFETPTVEPDSGNASRFFKSIIYQAKPSKAERNRGCEAVFNLFEQSEGVKQDHPTLKPIALMEYLIKMVTPKGGVVLDPFNGSGSTGCAAVKNGFEYIGIDITPEYITISEKRIKSYTI